MNFGGNFQQARRGRFRYYLNTPHTNRCNPSGIVDIYLSALVFYFSIFILPLIIFDWDVCLKLRTNELHKDLAKPQKEP